MVDRISNLHSHVEIYGGGRGRRSVRKMVMMMIKSAETGLVPAIAAIVILGSLKSLGWLFQQERYAAVYCDSSSMVYVLYWKNLSRRGVVVSVK